MKFKSLFSGLGLSLLLVLGFYLVNNSSASKNTNSHLKNFYAQNLSSSSPKIFTENHLLGKISIIHIWASWCGLCKSETPVMNSIWEKLKTSDKLNFLAVATGDTLENIYKTQKFKDKLLPLAFDIKESLGEDMNIDSIPYTIIFDPQGKMLHKFGGRLNQEEIDQILSYK